MKMSPSIQNLASALNKAQAEISGAVKDSKNPFFKSDYADLKAVIKAIKEPMINNGLSVSQFPVTNDSCTAIGARTLLMHDSGEFMEDCFYLPMSKLTAQDGGSCLTYAKRYSLAGVFNLPTLDDDAEAAMFRGDSSSKVEFFENLLIMDARDFNAYWSLLSEEVQTDLYNSGSKNKKTKIKNAVNNIERAFHDDMDKYAVQLEDMGDEVGFSESTYDELKSELTPAEWECIKNRLSDAAITFFTAKHKERK